MTSINTIITKSASDNVVYILLSNFFVFFVMKNSEIIIIREAFKNDIEQILEIQKDCNLSQWSRESYNQEILRKDSIFFIAVQAAEVYGFIVGRQTVCDSGSENCAPFSEAEILNFGVAKKIQKKGIGNKLFEKFLYELKTSDVKTIWLEVRAGNMDALSFYQKRGFLKTQTRKNFYTNPSEDAYLMKFSFEE